MSIQAEVAYDPFRTPYLVSEADYPADCPSKNRYLFLLRYAVLAPSTFNTQPWRFAVDDGGIDVYADLERRVPVVDPYARELLLSIGAAVFNLRVAAARFREPLEVSVNAEDFHRGPVARIRPGPGQESDLDLSSLFPGITRRHTNREQFLLSRIPAATISALEAIPPAGGAALVVSTDGRQNSLVADLVAEGDRVLLADQEYRTSIAEWTRPAWTEKADGVPATNLGVRLATGLAPWATKVLDLSRIRAAIDHNLCIEAPGLVVVTGEEAPGPWIEAGQMLQRLLLTLVREGLQYSYFNIPVQVPGLRLRLRAMFGLDTWPQLLLRVGYSFSEPRPTPRRPVEEVLFRRPPF